MGNRESVKKYRKEHISRIVVNLKKEDRAEWDKAAEKAGVPLATLIRQLMSDYMEKSDLVK